MKFALGFYSQISQSAPAPVPARALACIIKPVLTYIYNNRDCRLSIAQGSAMTTYLSWHFPEMNLLISSLAKAGSLEMITSSYNNAVLPLIPHKDRSSSVDKTTTLIRKTYGVRATSLWCYGQIWAPSVIAMMKTIGLDRLVISGYDALSRRNGNRSSFRMNELGRKIDVIQSDDHFSRLVSSYAQNEISLAGLKKGLSDYIRNRDKKDDLVCMINLDQLCQGASYNREDDEQLADIFISLFSLAREEGYAFSLMRDLVPSSSGYLPSGWYGRDAASGSLGSFNELFCRNETYRYYLGRYLALSAFVDESKKDRVLRRRLQEMLAVLPSGSLFICDTHSACLSLAEHRQFYKTILEAEKSLEENKLMQTSADVDDDGLDEEFCYGRQANAVFSLIGGAVHEFSSKELLVNVFDTVPVWTKQCAEQVKTRSFTDCYVINGREYNLAGEVYNLDSVSRSRNEFYFSYDNGELPFSVSKHYRLSNQNLYLSHTIVNRSAEFLKGEYIATVYFTLPGSSAFAWDARKGPLVGESLSGIKSVRFMDSSRRIQLSFTSTDFFSVGEENRFQSEVTTLGSEQFYLYTKVQLHFALNVAPESAASLNIVTRISSSKEK